MKIAIDASSLARSDPTGVAVYGTSLIRALAALDRDNRYALCYKPSQWAARDCFYRPAQVNFKIKVVQDCFPSPFLSGLDVYHGLAWPGCLGLSMDPGQADRYDP